jgi:hypothetical protein
MSRVKEATMALRAIQLPTAFEVEFVQVRATQGVQADCIVDEVLDQRKKAQLVNELIDMLGSRNLLVFLSGSDYVAAIRKVEGGVSVQDVIAEIESSVAAFKKTVQQKAKGLSEGPG